MTKRNKNQEVYSDVIEEVAVEVVAEVEAEAVVELAEEIKIVYSTPAIEEAWTGEKVAEVSAPEAVVNEGGFQDSDTVTFLSGSGQLRYGNYKGITDMGYKAIALYQHPLKK